MRIEFDRTANAAYIYLESAPGSGEVANTYACDPSEIGGQINLDFDASGRLLGIEVLDATLMLPAELLEVAETIDQD